jgi:hypothetical protein
MKVKILSLTLGAAFALAHQTVHATEITGNIGFSGSAQLNSTSVATATEVVSWLPTIVNSESGDFSGITIGSAVALAAPWLFNSGPLNNFWSVGGFTFNLTSSSIFSQNSFLNVNLVGTITGNGFTASPFTGTFQVANPSANGQTTFTERLSFVNATTGVPDGGSTVMMLGLSALGMGLLKQCARSGKTAV